jgi:hypothetical protein
MQSVRSLACDDGEMWAAVGGHVVAWGRRNDSDSAGAVAAD